MMPVQSIEESTPHPGPGPPPAPTASSVSNGVENGESRHLKPKSLPCKYCSKRFRRVEHVQRHERTHTKEKPFSCNWARCGKTFGRRDLLVRHEKLVHLNENSKDGTRPRKISSASGGTAPTVSIAPEGISRPEFFEIQRPSRPQYRMTNTLASSGHVHHMDPRHGGRSGAGNLDLLSDAALASEVTSQMQPMPSNLPTQPAGAGSKMKSYDDAVPFGGRLREELGAAGPAFPNQQHANGVFDDYNFLDEFAASSNFFPPPFEPDQPFSMWPRPAADAAKRGAPKPGSQFASSFSSLQPDSRDTPGDLSARPHEDQTRIPLRILPGDYAILKNRIDSFSSVLPNDFAFPSRHTLMRFFDGYMSGFHDHLPFLHIPSLVVTDIAPELLLAILAVGAHYRFESLRGYALWYASRSVALEQIRRRHSHEVLALLPATASYSPHSTRPSPTSGLRHSFGVGHQDRPNLREDQRDSLSPSPSQPRLETIQAILLLFAVGLWGAKAILHDALSLQSQLAMLLRDEGLDTATSPSMATEWIAWIRLEVATRTKLIAYCFFNLCSVTYNMPPMLLISDLGLFLPQPSQLWKAENSWQWQDARKNIPAIEITVQDAFARLFGRSQQPLPANITSLGSYTLIHALIQHIYLLKQTSIMLARGFGGQRSLKQQDVDDVSHALRVWQVTFENGPQGRAADSAHLSGDLFPAGHMAFSSTALLRLAHIRLYTDIVPCHGLETRDHVLVVNSLGETPPLVRNVRLHRAIYQAIHALSMLVRAGVSYVARTKSLEWSVQYSFCNYECAILLSKWLLTLSMVGPSDPPASQEEKGFLETIRRLLDETEFAIPSDPPPTASSGSGSSDGSQSDSSRLRQLAAAVIRLWAETFKGSHIFEVVRVMGSSLDGYGDLVERPLDRTPQGRITIDAVIG